MKKLSLLLMLWLVVGWMALPGCSNGGGSNDDDSGNVQLGPGDNWQDGNLAIDEERIEAVAEGGNLAVFVPIEVKDSSTKFVLDVYLDDLENEEVLKNSIEITQDEGEAIQEVTLDGLPSDFDDEASASYILRFDARSKDGRIWGTRSLFSTYRFVQVKVMGSSKLFESGESYYKVLARNPNSGKPVEGATADISLVDADGNSKDLIRATTDELGMADIKVQLPDGEFGSRDLSVDVQAPDGSNKQTVAGVVIERESKILLTTDKPMYQPGQLIHMRALALRRPLLVPVDGTPVTFWVTDPKGNKVFKEQTETSEWGVAATHWRLASLVNEGLYTITAEVGDFSAEKTVTVERYALPKYAVEFAADRSWYRPGDTVHASVQADYFFGKPVAGDVQIVASTFDVEMVQFQNVTGEFNSEGHFEFDLSLPSYFVGSALDQGGAYAFLEITTIDSAGHAIVKNETLLVVDSALAVTVVPETGSVVPGVENRFFLLGSDPLGKPVTLTATVKSGETQVAQVETDARGLAEFSFTPQSTSDSNDVRLDVTAQTSNGESVTKTFDFTPESTHEFVIVRTDSPLYKVGDTMQIEVVATNDGWEAAHLPDRVYLDLIKNGQTHLMTIVELEEGKGNYTLSLDPTISGAVELMGYYIGGDSQIIRDRKLVFVELANSLTVEIKPTDPDKETFLPREVAGIELQVRDNEGNGVPAVVGVQVVDEAIYALSDMKPGLEKVYFSLEEELMTPRYEVHGYSGSDLLEPEPEDPEEAQERQALAEVYLAAAGSDEAYGVNIDTFSDVAATARDIAATAVTSDMEELLGFLKAMVNSGVITEISDLEEWVATRNSGNYVYDPWGHPYRFELDANNYIFKMTSAGLDEKWSSEDDVETQAQFYMYNGYFNHGDDRWDGDVALADDEAGGGNWAEPGAQEPPSDGTTDKGEGEGESESPEVHVRTWFPETLFVDPEVLTDDDGRAEVNVLMADSITSWRMTALASSLRGQIGSNVGNVIVFKDFFVDIDFPATLTQNDIVHVPVVIYNYLAEEQEVTLEAEAGDWVSFLAERSITVDVPPNSVKGFYFPVKVLKVGTFTFKATAFGEDPEAADAIERSIQVMPDGKEFREAKSARLSGDVTVNVTLPENAIEGGNHLLVKIYPGLFSQVVEGLDSLLQMPCGCFEQTSSSTYPNVLVLDYLVQTEQNMPETELTAREYINQGYQRLLSYEVDGGGFEWFGNDPAHRVLTAYGLMEFHDMSMVHDVDPAIITRTQDWLLSLAESDGHYEFDAGGIHEGATNNFTDSHLRTTAYIVWALAETGRTGSEVTRSVNWIKSHRSEAQDDYTRALMAHAILSLDPNDTVAYDVLNDLFLSRIEDESGVHWKGEGASEMYSRGDGAAMELTALIGQAFIKAGFHSELIGSITDWLLSKKGAFGEWSSTQGTIQALRFFLASLGAEVESADATIAVYANDQFAGDITVDESNKEILQDIDITNYLQTGQNSVKLQVAGEGNLMYSVVSIYWLPTADDPYSQVQGPLDIDISYDKTQLTVDDIVTATVTITNTLPQTIQKMLLVDIGLPPGFDLVSTPLNDMVEAGQLQKWENPGRQLVLYIEKVMPQQAWVGTYQLRATYPMQGSSGPAEVHPYYDPDEETAHAPQEFTVTEN